MAPVRLRIELTVVDARDEHVAYTFSVLAASAVAEPAVSPEALEARQREMAAYVGMKGWGQTDDRGLHPLARFAVPAGLSTRHEAYLEYIAYDVRSLILPLPAQPVGVGARWTARQKIFRAIDSSEVRTFELTAQQAGLNTLEMDFVEEAAPQWVKGPLDPLIRSQRMEGLSSRGHAKSLVAFSQIVPLTLDFRKDAKSRWRTSLDGASGKGTYIEDRTDTTVRRLTFSPGGD